MLFSFGILLAAITNRTSHLNSSRPLGLDAAASSLASYSKNTEVYRLRLHIIDIGFYAVEMDVKTKGQLSARVKLSRMT